MAKSPGAMVRRDHHQVGGPVRRPSGGGDRGEERAAVLQPLEAPRRQAAPAPPWSDELGPGVLSAGMSPSWGRSRAMARPPGEAVRRDHHLVEGEAFRDGEIDGSGFELSHK